MLNAPWDLICRRIGGNESLDREPSRIAIDPLGHRDFSSDTRKTHRTSRYTGRQEQVGFN